MLNLNVYLIRFSYNELSYSIGINEKRVNNGNISKTIGDHVKYCLIIESFDQWITIKLLLIYYFAIFIINMCLIILIKSEPIIQINGNTIVNLFIILVNILSITLVSLIFPLISSVSKSAHLPYNQLYSLFIRNSSKLSIIMKFRIYSLISRLSGPKIGFTCYNTLILTNYDVFLFYSKFILFYILIMGFI
jgi:hypothetical protein